MPSSRRTFLKTSLIASASAAVPAFASEVLAQSAHPSAPSAASPFNRGIGVYPGAPGEFFCPTFVIDSTTYRNLALNRPATASSAYDYNLTAQLVTDGIKDTTLPRWIASATSADGILPKHLREAPVSHWPAAAATPELKGGRVWTWVQLGGGPSDAALPEIDHVKVFFTLGSYLTPSRITVNIATSDDGETWQQAGTLTNPTPIDGTIPFPPDLNRGNNLFYPVIPLTKPCRSRFYRAELILAGVGPDDDSINWRFGQIEFYQGAQRVEIGGPYSFTSAWKSASLDEEWVAVDLGAPCTFDRITLHWIARAAEGAIQTSTDGTTWHTLRPLPASTSQVDDIHLAAPARASHIRVLMTRPTSPDGYILSEIEVFGRGGPVAKPAPAPSPTPEGRLNLAGGRWRVQRENLVAAPGPTISKPSYSDADWLVATVPGTIQTSYLNAGAIPDPNYGANQLQVSDSFFYSDFWYRTVFTPPPARPGQIQWLNFDGIDWKAQVFLNGEPLGNIAGGFIRGRFDVTSKLIPGQPNVLAVRVDKNDTPGSCKQKTYESPGVNGGALGADNPTFHSSIGWDWIPTVRGRNTGIWGEVFLETTGAVTLHNPAVTSVLSDNNQTAQVTLAVEAVNHTAQPIKGTLEVNFGEIAFGQAVTVPPSSRITVTLDPSHHPIENPRLWWPAGYGDPYLYDVRVAFETSNTSGIYDGFGSGIHQISDKKTFKAGIRQMTASEDGGDLRLFINGRRFIPRGGNWGFGEVNLRYRAREYDAAVRYHREMNFTMIRNWVGQIPDDAFYEACDRHGIVVWQDFWLANPWDGPIPNDNALFLSNARDLILRIRSHASVGLYVGRNEGFPPPILEAGLRQLIAELHPDIHYIGSSADGVVSGHGPYRALPPAFYFEHTDSKFHSEIGMPNIPTIESVRAMMPAADLWPQGLTWGLHDFCLHGAQGGESFLSLIADGFGGATSVEEWVTLAQFLNYEGYRAMFEAQSKHRMGVLLWMSHPCWPSFVWQTYDWYLEPTAAYFGCKKASEPIHIQWNRFTGHIEVVNLSAGNLTGLTAQLELLNLDGSVVATQTAQLDSPEDSVATPIVPVFPATLSPVHFLRLTLTKNGSILSTNIYLRGKEDGNYRAIRELPKVRLTSATTAQRTGDKWLLTTALHNPSPTPALMIRLKAVRELAGDRILPVIYSDNYITLMPNESCTVTTELAHADTRAQHPKIALSGFNIIPS
jgi:hypothetical protein